MTGSGREKMVVMGPRGAYSIHIPTSYFGDCTALAFCQENQLIPISPQEEPTECLILFVDDIPVIKTECVAPETERICY